MKKELFEGRPGARTILDFQGLDDALQVLEHAEPGLVEIELSGVLRHPVAGNLLPAADPH